MKRQNALVSVLLVCVLVVSACNTQEEKEPIVVMEPKEQGISYTTAEAGYDDIVVTDTISCTYTQTDSYDLSFGLSDYEISTLNVKKGELVQKGQLLGSLDVGDMEKQIPALSHEVEVNQLKLKQQKELQEFDKSSAYTLMANGCIDQTGYNEKIAEIEKQYRDTISDLEDAVSISSARLKEAKEQVENGMIYAPVTGVVTFVCNLGEGSYSTAGETIVTVSDLSSCYFETDNTEYTEYFAADEIYRMEVTTGKETKSYDIVPAEMETWEENGHMRFALSDDTEVVDLGTEGKLVVNLGEKESVLCVPSMALHTTEDGYYVYLLKDDMRQMQPVEIGLSSEDKTEIVDGLKENDVIILKQEVGGSDESK